MLLNKVIHGDCLIEMKSIQDKSIDMILCDLPYGTTACKWDTIIPFEPLWEQYKRIIKDNGAIVLTASQPFTTKLISSNFDMFKYEWIWKKESGTGANQSKNMPLRDYEDVCVFSKGSIGHSNLIKNRMIYNPQGLRSCNKTQKHGSWGMEGTQERKSQTKEIQVYFENYPKMVLEFNRDTKKLHPTQKPVALFEYLIKTYTNEGETVLDNCAGSGTTAIACMRTNRNYILIEKEQNYIDIINQRIKDNENLFTKGA